MALSLSLSLSPSLFLSLSLFLNPLSPTIACQYRGATIKTIITILGHFFRPAIVFGMHMQAGSIPNTILPTNRNHDVTNLGVHPKESNVWVVRRHNLEPILRLLKLQLHTTPAFFKAW
jgi:hypothetical protein